MLVNFNKYPRVSMQLQKHMASWSCVGLEPKDFEVPAIFFPHDTITVSVLAK